MWKRFHRAGTVKDTWPGPLATLDAESDAAIVESVKAASDVYSPISGEVKEVNSLLEDQPEIINSSPYEDGWFYKISPSDLGELDNLLSPEDYSAVCED